MAKIRTRNYDNSKVRFGRGGSHPGKSEVVHIGTKDPEQKRDKLLNFRVTAKELEFIRNAYRDSGVSGFGQFATDILIDGIEGRNSGFALLTTDYGVSLAAIGEMRNELNARMDAIDSAHIQFQTNLDENIERQILLARLMAAQSENAMANTKAVAQLANSVETLATRMDKLLSRLSMELGERRIVNPTAASQIKDPKLN